MRPFAAFCLAPLLVALACASQGVSAGGRLPLEIAGLDQNCKLSRQWYGQLPNQPWAGWLTCEGADFLLQGPNNLVGHIRLNTVQEVTTYIRFFTNEDGFHLFPQPGLLDLSEQPDQDSWITDLRSILLERGIPLDIEVELLPSPDSKIREFLVRRTVVAADGSVQRVREFVRSDGFYQVAYEGRLLDDISDLGFQLD